MITWGFFQSLIQTWNEHLLTDVRNIFNLDGLDFVIIWEEEASSSWELNHHSLCDFWLSQCCLWDRKRATLNCLIRSLLLVVPQFSHILNLQASKDWRSCNELKNPAFSWACKLQFASVREQSFDKQLALHQCFSVPVTYWKLSTYLHFRKCIVRWGLQPTEWKSGVEAHTSAF